MEIITTHKNVDFDALAASVAAGLLYPDATLVMPRRVNPNARTFLSIHKDLIPHISPKEVPVEQVRRLVVVDTNKWQRLDGLSSLKGRPGLEVHLWDHHPEDGDIEATEARNEPVGAASTLLVEELQRREVTLTPIQATLFLAGIYEDTGNLSFPATSSRDARAAAYLLEASADLALIRRFLQPAYGQKQKDVLFDLIKSASRTKVDGYHVSIIRHEVRGHLPNLSLVMHMYREILNVDVAFGIFVDVDHGHCMVIGRSVAEAFNVGAMMNVLGGGGHPAAGSALVKNVPAEKIEAQLWMLVRSPKDYPVMVQDLMTSPVRSVSTRTPMKDVAKVMAENGHSGLPVVKGEKVVGIISRRDLNRIEHPAQWEEPVASFMSHQVLTIEPEAGILEAVKVLVKHDIGRLPVMEGGRMVGIVTRSDVMIHYYNLL